jgi:hypothetical protein
MEPPGALERQARAALKVAAVEPQAAAERAAERRRAVEGAVRAGPWVVAAEPQAAGEPVAEPWGVREGLPQAGPRPPAGMKVEPSAGAAAVARRAQAAPWAVAPVPAALPSRGHLPAVGCRSIRRICFRRERFCDTSGTPPELPGRPGCAEPGRGARRPRAAFPFPAAFRNACRRPPSPGSCFRRFRSVRNVPFLVRWCQRSYASLFSNWVGTTRRQV